MKDVERVINDLLVDIFDDIVTVEQEAIASKGFQDISIKEVHTIEAIGIEKLKSMSKIASELRITVGTLTTAISNLVKKGYVNRKKSELDRRVIKVSLTKKGELVYRLHEKFHKDMVSSCVENLTEKEMVVLVKSLDKLINFFRKKYIIKK